MESIRMADCINQLNADTAMSFCSTLERKLYRLQDREPLLIEKQHSIWQEKCDALLYIVNKINAFVDDDATEYDWRIVRQDIRDYQDEYGGLDEIKVRFENADNKLKYMY